MRAAALMLAIVSLPLAPAFADQGPPPPTVRPPPDDRALLLAFGAGGAFRRVPGATAMVLPLELTLSVPPYTASTGAVFSGDGLAHAYFEIGLYLGLSLAAGVGYGTYQTPEGRKGERTYHLFFGVPIPVRSDRNPLDAKWLPYVVPYYRPSWGESAGAAHEFGMMIKVSYALIAGHMSFRD